MPSLFYLPSHQNSKKRQTGNVLWLVKNRGKTVLKITTPVKTLWHYPIPYGRSYLWAPDSIGKFIGWRGNSTLKRRVRYRLFEWIQRGIHESSNEFSLNPIADMQFKFLSFVLFSMSYSEKPFSGYTCEPIRIKLSLVDLIVLSSISWPSIGVGYFSFQKTVLSNKI